MYALIAAITAHLAVAFEQSLNNRRSSLFKFIDPLTPEKGINDTYKFIAGALITFFVSFLIYNFMYFVFGWGGGMIVPRKAVRVSYF